MKSAIFEKITLKFKVPSGTSRGILKEKDSWILKIWNNQNPVIIGQGEASIIKSLSPDWSESYELKLEEVSKKIDWYLNNLNELNQYPSIQFAIESAVLDLNNGGQNIIFPEVKLLKNPTIPINGLIWMGDKDFMTHQIKNKIKAGYNCIKLKIGAIDFNTELDILSEIRSNFSSNDIELRVDANGAFTPKEALKKLNSLAQYDIHSIEQPIMPKQIKEMANICSNSPIPVALDEELIGIQSLKEKNILLKQINPQYIILKPSLIGGFRGTDQWIKIAEEFNINWWITSALESNIGLNAIAQYAFTKNNPLPQGLGTGSLFINNIPPFLNIKNGNLEL